MTASLSSMLRVESLLRRLLGMVTPLFEVLGFNEIDDSALPSAIA